jgi:two-component system sensor histidine kinase KdpD
VVYALETVTVERFSNIGGLLIIAVLVSAILLGTGPAIVTAVACSLLYDWLVVPPFFGTANGLDNVIKFAVFVSAALLTSWIAGMAKAYAVALSRRERDLTAALNEKEALRREKEQETVRREVETLRNAILASVSHDLKTPLSSIIGAMSSLRLYGGGLSEDDRQHLTGMVLSEANRLLGYVNNILEVARLEDRAPILKSDLLAVDDVIDLTVKRLAPRLRHFRLEVVQDGEDLSFHGDERLMDIALGNLLDNAMKHSPAGARIGIGSRRDPGAERLLIEVEDQGAGIPKALWEEVFDKYYRVRQSDTRNMGTGLGLWITRRIVEAHGGSVALAAPRQGRGARVVIALPAAPAARPLPARETA